VCSLWQKHFLIHELTEIMRQREDPEFASILSRIRIGTHTAADCQALSILENNDSLPDNCLAIYCINMQADEYNANQLAKITTQIYTIVADDSKRDKETGRVAVTVEDCTLHKTGGLAKKIKIAVNAQYMHIKNTDLGDGLVNGATGIITHIDIDLQQPLKGTIYVKFDNPNIGRQAQQKSKYHSSVPIKATTVQFPLPKTPSVLVERTQYPGVLAWGVTVHKAQGSTYEKMIAHIGKPKSFRRFHYNPGQIYTMLSWAKTRKNLKIIDFNPNAIVVNKDSLAEIKRMENNRLFYHQTPLNALPDNYIIAIGHLNVRSLSLHYEDVLIHANNCPVDVFCMTETHVHNYQNYSLPGFDVFSTASNSSPSKRGCAIYCRKRALNEHTNPVCHHFNYSRNIETTAVIFDSHMITCVYVPPKMLWTEIETFFTEMLTECISVIAKEYKCNTITFIGDFNTGHDSTLQKLTDLFSEFGLQQYISTPTHNLCGMLDLIFTTHTNTQTTTHPLYFTDHHFIAARFYPT
jgi:hypothetical protein